MATMQGAAAAVAQSRWVRPGQLGLAAIALIAGGVSLWLPTVSVLGLPLLLSAVRFFELARFRLVHRSGWLLVASLYFASPLILNVPWLSAMEIGYLALFVLLGIVLFVQQRDHQLAMRQANMQSATQDGEDWALGGILALPAMVLFVVSLSGMMAYTELLALAAAASALLLLWLQLTRCWRFPGLMRSWLLLATIFMIVNAIARDNPVSNVVPGCVIFALAWLYLRFAARVRRTFSVPNPAA